VQEEVVAHKRKGAEQFAQTATFGFYEARR
jgi:hypothetical protein